MAITQAVCTSFKVDLLYARHNFNSAGGHTFKCALYDGTTATLGATTTAYTTTGEKTGTAYTAGGNTLTNIAPSASSTTAITSFSATTWSTSTITNARGALIYNDTATTPVADAACIVLDFVSDKSSTAGDFTIVFPTPADSTNAIIRIV